ncbi:glutathione S-transferase [Pacificimonas flava]|uniref:Glutathione S-transferase n=2 Tax=Pacificimonas TaxID=1960290 RepID=A0A219B492_9SPHN|nr:MULTISPECIES: glutathione S-transferase family protein [Pacificimonas]MBZ6377690.1 glutathione S-transferase family protein [Pacificimonas aurantium]OWV32629.1 glutathione S-transferase [Pacificimonas flava]
MWTLYQFPLCPFSRKVRIALAEKNVDFALELEYPWARSDRLLGLNQAGQTPVLAGEKPGPLVHSQAICEYFEETVEKAPLLGSGSAARAEVRRLTAWFDEKCYAEATNPLLLERMYKRVVLRQPPEARTLRAASQAVALHLDRIEALLGERRWLAGATFSLADVAAFAQLSVADYLGGLGFSGYPDTKQWYSAVKSRPSVRRLLPDRMEGLVPPPHYDKLDF